MKKFYKNLPIEAYVILLPSIVFLLWIGIYIFSRGIAYAVYFLKGHFFSLIIDVNIIFPVIFLIAAVSVIQILFMVKDGVNRLKIIDFIRSSLFLLGIFYISGVALSASTQLIFNIADPIRTAANSIIFTKWDYAVFGTYPWLSLHSFITAHWLQVFIYLSYLNIEVIMLALLAVLAFKSTFLFRKFLLSYFIVTAIAIPFWVIFPALAPDMMYRVNILNTAVQPELKSAIDNTHFSKTTQIVLSRIEKIWIDDNGKSLPVTSFPSMHAAWGIIVVVIGIELWAPAAFVLIPWFFAELAGTLLTLEHYTADVLFGILLGFFVLYLASRLLAFDKKRFVDRWDIFISVRQLQESPKKVLDWIKIK